VLYLKESPDGEFMTSLGQDEIMFVWVHSTSDMSEKSSSSKKKKKKEG